MSSGILIWAELTRDKYINTVCFELAAKARELTLKMRNTPLEALIFLPCGLIDEFKSAFSNSGFDKVYYIEDDKFNEYKTDLFSYAAIKAVKEIEPEIILFGATCMGRDLAPRISTALHTGLTADCTALDIDDNGKLAATRPTFGGQLMATILSKNTPQMATVRPKVFKPAKEFVPLNTEFIKLNINISDYVSKLEILNFKEKILSGLNELDSAEIVVAGGKGMQSSEGFDLLKRLADKLGGAVGASRAAVEMGLASPECQIGQTGKTVSPKLYIACGISGALQHVVGMENSSKIIAINSDKDAPIFDIADTGIVGDVFKVIPDLLSIL